MTIRRKRSAELIWLSNKIEILCEPINNWLMGKLIEFSPWLKRSALIRRLLNKWVTNKYANFTRPRPSTLSLWVDQKTLEKAKKECAPEPVCDYMSWPAITDKNYFSRHVEPGNLKFPNNDRKSKEVGGEITELFRREGEMKEGRSNVFFMFFAQWFTDGFFRSERDDTRKTGSRHNVDLVQIYGSNEEMARALRSGVDGKLSADYSTGEELPDLLYEKTSSGEYEIKQKYQCLPYLNTLEEDVKKTLSNNYQPGNVIQQFDAVKPILRATGLDRGNTTIGNLAINTLFLREHNSICDAIKLLPEMQLDDERIFQTARMINIVLLVKLTFETYINHIGGVDFLELDNSFAEKQDWYREPWIAAEFNMTYRWHGLVPDKFHIGDKKESFISHFGLLENKGLGGVIDAALLQAAGDIGIGNTPDFLMWTEEKMIENCRDWNFKSYNDYRVAFGLRKLDSYDQLTDDIELGNKLKKIYGHIDNLELPVGWYAESKTGKSILGGLQARMVGYDAVTQLYTNPLLAKKNFTPEHFTKVGIDRIETTNSLADFITRNAKISRGIKIDFKKPEAAVCPFSRPIKQTTTTKDVFRNIPCPNLRVGVRMGLLEPDAHGWVESAQLRKYLTYLGLKDKSNILEMLIREGEKANEGVKDGYINLAKLRGSLLDHAGSTGTLDNPPGLNLENLNELKSFAVDGRLGTNEFAKASQYFRDKRPKNTEDKLGFLIQSLEFSSILDIYGTADARGSKYLTVKDLDDLWRKSCFPKAWKAPTETYIGSFRVYRRAIWFAMVRMFCGK